ncbi:hypothetical protein [Lysinibacillus sphaericus]|uniref:hypothetical protein n=1 Tax=Lysinibacillus sphaericus TaxID=1421 RepID=UPI0003A6B81F|nr:hypothetical protein [Lysinibacillus sphaericus]
MAKNNNRGIYIQSVEASKIYNHEFRGAHLKNEYLGMLPYSLMSIKLQNLKGFKVKENESKTKYITDDIINVSFNYNAEANADNTIEYLSSIYNRNLSKLDEVKTDKAKNNALNKLESLQEYIDKIKADKDKDVWKLKLKMNYGNYCMRKALQLLMIRVNQSNTYSFNVQVVKVVRLNVYS